jgi:hypothetical protein
MLRRKEIAVFIILLVVVASFYALSAVKVQALRDQLDPTQVVSALQVRPEVLEILSGEFSGLLADYLLLKASVYLGGRDETPDANKEAVATLFRQAATLDPYFFQTCYFVQGFVPWWKGKFVSDALATLEIIKEHRDWHWEPGFYIGFDYFFFLRDNLTASRHLMDASKLQNAPPLLWTLGARLSQRGGDTLASIAFLKTIYAGTENKAQKEEMQRRIEALNGVLILEKAIAQFRSMFFDRPPDTLKQLMEAGILKELPVNPARNDGKYLYENGKIDF